MLLHLEQHQAGNITFTKKIYQDVKEILSNME